ncbi:hypothetical protein [Hymenobacter metallilatus]|uniref:Outer membrane protein beta-barrel domain-containing protein n=1 Tax=Hymenobacter metallilatus TaxID=2493666 RepID=A0A3R9M6W9_9BACT|nr:hypothetical protein [Hymenobacter metallilatus]RSK31689.1 hypothetical protein EI290_12730 [Hymenobacter metallilatus]
MQLLLLTPLRRLTATLLLSVSGLATLAQTTGADQETYETQKRLSVGVTKYAEARAALTGFIRRRALRVQKQEETPEQLTAEFSLSATDLPRLDSLAAGLGYVLENNLNTHNLASRLQELGADERAEAARLANMQSRLREEKLPADERIALQNDVVQRETRLRQLQQQQLLLSSHQGQAYVSLRLFDEISFPTGNRRVSFVNMPGVEYAYLRLDNPKVGLTSPAYQGYAIKYLFTRGKSYFNLGVYKPTTANKTDSAFVNELFVINFGQDFYPRNFGQGRRRYLNLYTSYQVGGFILNRNDDTHNDFIPNLNLGLGVELIKTRHILLDTKGSYFVPLNSRSRDLRGLLGQASFNFVF